MTGDRGVHGLFAPPVLRAQAGQVVVVAALAHEPLHDVLTGDVRAGVHGLLAGDQQPPQPRVGVHPPHAQPRGEDLGEGPHREHERVVRADLPEPGDVLAGEAQAPVRVVVDDHGAPPVREVQEAPPARLAQRGAGGVLEVRDRVDRPRGAPGLGDQRLQRVHVHAVLVDGDLEQVRAVAEGGAGAVRVGGGLDHHEVARVHEELEREVEALHAAGGDDEPFGPGRLRGRGVVGHDGLEQTGLALRGPVRERAGAEDLGGDPPELLRGDHLGGRGAHREADDVVGLGGEQGRRGVDDRPHEPVRPAGQGQQAPGGVAAHPRGGGGAQAGHGGEGCGGGGHGITS